MVSVASINNQISFEGSKGAKRKEKAQEPKKSFTKKVIDKAYDSFVKTVNKKYDVEYESLEPKQRKTIKKDFFTEKALCIGSTLLTICLFLPKGRDIVSGLMSAADVSAKKLLNKGQIPLKNHQPAQDLGSWATDKVKRIVFASHINSKNKAINSGVGNIISDAISEESGNIKITSEILDKIAKNAATVNGCKVGNPKLAEALKGHLGQTLPLEEVDSIVAANQAKLFSNGVVYGNVDPNSKFHKFLSKIFKNSDTLKNVESTLGNGYGIKNFEDVAETAIAGGVTLKLGSGVGDGVDYLTDKNDGVVGDAASAQAEDEILGIRKRIAESRQEQKNVHFSKSDLEAMARAAMLLMPGA